MHIQNPGISKTLAHSEPETYSESWAIQNPGIFRTGPILRTLSNIYHGALLKIANGYNYFRKLLSSQYQPFFLSSSSWNKYDFLIQVKISLQKSLCNVKMYGGQWLGPLILIYLREVLKWYYLLLLTFNIF